MGRVWKKKCPVCGAEFEAGTSNAKYCAKCRLLGKQAREHLLRGGKISCVNCGKEFEGHGNARLCGEECHKAWILRQRLTKSETASRACHDCGRPTTDYRCPACRAAFRQRHGASEHPGCGEEWIYA